MLSNVNFKMLSEEKHLEHDDDVDGAVLEVIRQESGGTSNKQSTVINTSILLSSLSFYFILFYFT